MNLLDAVKARRSVRNYDPVALKGEHAAFIRSWLDAPDNVTGPFGRRYRVHLLDDVAVDRNAVGTYGFTKGVRQMLVAVAPRDPLALFGLAHVFHGLILELTARSLGTVWMGAAFSRHDVLRSVSLDDGEIIAAIPPVGYPGGRKSIKQHLFFNPALTRTRKPMRQRVFMGDFATPQPDDGDALYAALDLARLAPSARNKQPWRVVVDEDRQRVHFYVEHGLRGQVGDGPKMYACDPEFLDLGTFTRSFEVAMHATGESGTFVVEPPPLSIPANTDMTYVTSWLRS